jgi:hexosaminidase
MHLENNEAWIEVMAEQHKNFKGSIRGIAITGWQRYDHLATLCELLPVIISIYFIFIYLNINFYLFL